MPLLVVYDAQDYLTRGRITQIVDNLIAQGRIEPFAIALLDNGKQPAGSSTPATTRRSGLS